MLINSTVPCRIRIVKRPIWIYLKIKFVLKRLYLFSDPSSLQENLRVHSYLRYLIQYPLRNIKKFNACTLIKDRFDFHFKVQAKKTSEPFNRIVCPSIVTFLLQYKSRNIDMKK